MANTSVHFNKIVDPDSGREVLTDDILTPDSTVTTSTGDQTLVEALNSRVSMTSPNSFGATGDGVSDDSQSFIDCISHALTNDLPIFITSGEYLVKNIDFTGTRVFFNKGASLNLVLGSLDNGIVVGSNTEIYNPVFVMENTAQANSGNHGNAFRIGNYRSIAGDSFENIKIINPVVYSNNTEFYGQASEILGNVNNLVIENPEIYGRLSAGIVAHWGGDVSEQDPHFGTVTESYHPHNASIKNPHFGPNDGLSGGIGIILSAVYDFSVSNVTTDGWSRPIFILPGDVYNQVSTPGQADKVMTGISVDGVNIYNPPVRDPSKHNSLVTVWGITATNRTAATSKTLMADENGGISITGVTMTLDSGQAYSGAPLVMAYYTNNTNIEFQAEGFEDKGEYLFREDFCTNTTIKAKGKTGSGVYHLKSVDCAIDIESEGDNEIGLSCISSPSEVQTTTLSSAVSVGDTSVSVNALSGAFAGYYPKGTRLYLDAGGFYESSASFEVSTSVGFTIPIYPASSSSSSGAGAKFRGSAVNLDISGEIRNYDIGVDVEDTDGINVNCSFQDIGKYSILLVGESNDNADLIGSSDKCGTRRDGSLLADVHLGTAGDNIKIEMDFNTSGASNSNYNVYGNLGTELSNVIVTKSYIGGGAVSGISFANQSASASQRGKHQVFGNSYRDGTTVVEGDGPIGQFIGQNFYGSATQAPTSGYWRTGDRLTNRAYVAGSVRGWLCSATGNPGTWSDET